MSPFSSCFNRNQMRLEFGTSHYLEGKCQWLWQIYIYIFFCIHFHNIKNQVYPSNRLALFQSVWKSCGLFEILQPFGLLRLCFRGCRNSTNLITIQRWLFGGRDTMCEHESFISNSSSSLKLFCCFSSGIVLLSALPLSIGSIDSSEDEFISARILCQLRSRAVCFYAHLPIGISVTCLDSVQTSSLLWNIIGT